MRALEPRQGKQPHLRFPLTAQPERLARATLPFIAAVTVVLAPVTYITSAFSNGLLRALGNAGEGEGLRITNSELRMILGGAGQVCPRTHAFPKSDGLMRTTLSPPRPAISTTTLTS